MSQVIVTAPATQVIVTSPTTATVTTATAGPQGQRGPAGTQPVFQRSGTLTTQTGTSRFYVENSGTIGLVRASVGTAPTGSPIVVDVNLNGSSIFTNQANRPSIAAAAHTATATPNVTAITAGDFFTVDIDAVGSTNAGADLTVSVTIL